MDIEDWVDVVGHGIGLLGFLLACFALWRNAQSDKNTQVIELGLLSNELHFLHIRSIDLMQAAEWAKHENAEATEQVDSDKFKQWRETYNLYLDHVTDIRQTSIPKRDFDFRKLSANQRVEKRIGLDRVFKNLLEICSIMERHLAEANEEKRWIRDSKKR